MKAPLKSFIAVIILSALMVVACLYARSLLSSSSLGLEATLFEIEKSITSSDWENTSAYSKKLEEGWSSAKGLWAALIDHQEIDNIDETLSRLKKYVQTKDTSAALAEVSVLVNYIGHIPKKEALSLENFF